jgi:Tol biopolymer transport system component
VFVRDLQTGKTARVSLAAEGIEANGASVSSSTSLSADGRFVSFTSLARNLVTSDTNDVRDAFVRDLQAGGVLRVNVASDGAQANGRTRLYAVMSADARYTAFASAASNLAPLDLNRATDIFVRGPLF